MSVLDQITRQAGQGIDAIMNRIIGSIDGVLTAGIGKIGGLLGSDAPSAAEAHGTEGFMSRMMSAMGLDKSQEPAQAVAKVREPEIQAPTAQMDKYSVSLADLGGFSAPTLPTIVSQGQSRIV